METLFRRAFCEEVIPLRGEIPLEQRWDKIKHLIKSKRLLSIFVEEAIFNFSLLGMYQLGVSKESFLDYYNTLLKNDIGTRDKEGDMFTISFDEILSFFNCQWQIELPSFRQLEIPT